ncbi:sensor domain-containing protein [Streptomyces sp. NBC_00083]|uniref:sensor histidine kinase n=1 Tax=Streptomyces sp. NBC_00083 TaxID=2975647 RepID=UPI0022574AA4|nr:sensor domain-containing protein [Streptomyces sp. NBC_00083]MCX5382839.1 sensor domain-containing protein [Streptomyces sp. NBC_00083]
MTATKARDALLAGVRGLALAPLALAGSIVLFTLTVVSIGLIPIGVGVLTTPLVVGRLRAHADFRRELAARWSGVRIASAYPPPPNRPGLAGLVERCTGVLRSPATWHDLRWLLADMTGGFITALLPAALLLYLAYGWVLALGVWRAVADAGVWFLFIHVTSQASAYAAAALGTAICVLGLFVNPALLRGHFTLARALLAPSREAQLEQRVDRLTETRHDAVDTSAAELRRIERDLHDGAQARLVAMGMNLGTIEALVEKDPAQAKELLALARASSAEALTELRDLVRGIHPPVLAERGLADAVRALALRTPVPTEVTVELPDRARAQAPVESAAYFAVSELLTNAVKHAAADSIWVDLSYGAGALRVSVGDNGRGGARTGAGGGLSGVERRLGTFDGVLAVSSPVGGPTLVTMEIPCALS